MNSGTLFLAAIAPDGGTNAVPGVLESLSRVWRSIDDGLGVLVFLLLGVVVFLAGLLVWWRIRRKIQNDRHIIKQIPSIIAHVHRVHPAYHILAAILGFSGLSMIAGFMWVGMFTKDANAGSYVMTSAGMALGVLTLILSIWTLNQTMRLERLQGEGIERFDQLIIRIAEELRELMKRYDANRDKSSDLFRVLLVTNNPYFGIISYKGKPVTRSFKNAFDALADCIQAEKAKSKTGTGFKVKVICADQLRLEEFISPYFEPGEKETEDAKRNLNELKTEVLKESEDFIKSLKDRTGEECIVRCPIRISEAQFAVIGDVVFEFLLEAPTASKSSWKARGSNIKATNRIEDRAAADRFQRFAQFLEELILDGNGTPPSQGGSGIPPTPATPAPGTSPACSGQAESGGAQQLMPIAQPAPTVAATTTPIQTETKEIKPAPSELKT